MRNFLIGTLCLSMTSLALAQSVSTGTTTTTATTGTTTTTTPVSGLTTTDSGGTTLTGSTTPTPTYLPTSANPTTSIQAQGQSGTSANTGQVAIASAGIVASTAVATHFEPSCFSSAPTGCVWFYAGIAGAVGSALIMKNAFSSSNGSTAATDAVTNPTTTTAPVTTTSGPAMSPSAVSALAALKAQGVGIDPNTGNVTLPNGSTLSGAALANGDMSGTGMSPADQQAAKGALGEIMKDAAAKAATAGTDNGDSSVAGGGGGGGASGTPTAGLGADGMGLGGGKIPARSAASNLGAGMKKVVAGGTDAIGVSSDDLFVMIGNRYKATGNSNTGFVSQ